MANRLRARHKEDAFRGAGNPAENIFCGVIARAAADLISSDRILRQNAIRWFLSPDAGEGTFLWLRAELELTRSADSLCELARCMSMPTVEADLLAAEMRELFAAGKKRRSIRPVVERLRLLSTRRAS